MASRRPSLVDEVRDDILGLMSAGTLKVGDQLPNEQEMCERWNVSRATIREAYRSLIAAGFLHAKRGSGTFVLRSPNQRSLDTSLSYMAMIADAGHTPGIRLIRREERAATTGEAERLKLPHDSRLLVVDRIHTADDHPVIFSRDRLPSELVSPTAFADMTGSLFSMMETVGYEPRSARARLTPVRTDEVLSQLLAVPEGAPLLHIDEIDYDTDGRAVLYSEEWHVGDVFPLWLNRRVTLHNDPY
ncbi:GntR family transcriptional regulator [Mycolicibacterium helvum]|uniref:GntR family transcriptional regulator n=1 Tax=Mycolicibacterium helvum TaxID=1534349 RepID=A0A7I7T0T0_9MYCO|nr:GntR family transcriptional regulator [Mycolicibacterium helvum]BBY62069.1 GntR family transcriptional regulator [Mycolicibacterium helvum]